MISPELRNETRRDSIKFLGTAGARFVVMRQLRASGGCWLEFCGKRILLDPGPGSLVRCLSSRPKKSPEDLDAIILSHRHLDHTCDVNVMIEAMTQGGHQKRGVLFAPRAALDEDPVVLQYIRPFLADIRILEEAGEYHFGDLRFRVPVRHEHPSETYGFQFDVNGLTISWITDTAWFPALAENYAGDILILHVVRYPKTPIYHLDLEDAERLIREIRPRLAILTHFGMTMIKAKPWLLAQKVQDRTGVRTIAARDGMTLFLDEIE